MLFILLISKENAKFVRIIFSFIKMLWIVIMFFVVSEVIIYSVSIKDNEILICFIKCQNTNLLVILIRDLVVDFLSCKSAFQSESEYLIRQNFWNSSNKTS